jgi:thiosulfate dehydrogenase
MRVISFFFGIVTAIVLMVVGVILFVKGGGFPMATSAPPLPYERTLAGMALHASIGGAAAVQNPVPKDERNMIAGAKVFMGHCAGCHGTPGNQSSIAKGMFPQPPQLFAPDEMVTDDPEGATYWIVTHGIRLSAMPGFDKMLSDTERWQVTMLAAHADLLSPSVKAALTR